jgi:hypothetical protein
MSLIIEIPIIRYIKPGNMKWLGYEEWNAVGDRLKCYKVKVMVERSPPCACHEGM